MKTLQSLSSQGEIAVEEMVLEEVVKEINIQFQSNKEVSLGKWLTAQLVLHIRRPIDQCIAMNQDTAPAPGYINIITTTRIILNEDSSSSSTSLPTSSSHHHD